MHSTHRLPGAIVASGPVAMILALALLSPPARAQGQWMDIGSGQAYTISVENEPRSRQRFAPFAFGGFGPGNYVYSELLPWPCSELPAPDFCGTSTFVRAFHAYLDTGTCPCTGVLFEPVELELGYDAARVAAMGIREQDLRLAMYDVDALGWVDLPSQQVLPDRDLVLGSQSGHARQFYAILVRPQEASTWGRIKAQWAGSRRPPEERTSPGKAPGNAN